MGAAGSGQLRFSFPVSREEHARALKASMARGPAAAMTRGMAIIFALVGVGVLIASASRTQVGPSAIMEAMPWLLLANFWAWLYRGIPLRWYTRAINRTMRQFPGEEVRELSEEGLYWSSARGAQHVTWDAVREVAETEEFFLLYTEGTSVCFIPKHAIPIELEEPVRALLARRFSARPERLHLLRWGT